MGENRPQKYNVVGFVALKCMAQMHYTNQIRRAEIGRKTMAGLIYNTHILRSDWAVSQRYGVISLVNSPPLTHNFAHVLSCVYKSKLK